MGFAKTNDLFFDNQRFMSEQCKELVKPILIATFMSIKESIIGWCKELVKPILIATGSARIALTVKGVQGIGKTNSNCNYYYYLSNLNKNVQGIGKTNSNCNLIKVALANNQYRARNW